MYQENNPVKSLTEEIMLVQLEDFCDGFDNSMKLLNEKTKKRLLAFGIPFLTGCTLGVATQNLWFLIGGTTIFAVGAMACTIKDDIEEERRIREKYAFPPKDIDSPFQKKEFDIHEPIMKKGPHDFYTEYAKEMMESRPDEEAKPKNDQPQEEIVLEKEEAMERIVYEYDIYSMIYKLPEMSITNREWDILFDTIYDELVKKQAESKFYKYMSFLNRYVFASSLVHGDKKITVYSYIRELKMLQKLGYQEIDPKEIERKIRSQLGGKKIIKLDTNAFRLKKK